MTGSRMKSTSVTICQRCKGKSQIENTNNRDAYFVRRTRACMTCGLTWSTAEVRLQDAQRLRKYDTLIRNFNRV